MIETTNERLRHRSRQAGLAAVSALTVALLCADALGAGPPKSSDPLVERGRYITVIGGCNDCHTPGYAMSGGKVDEKQWLTGDSLGWRGPWGTTYPVNLRQYMQTMSEKEWVAKAKKLETRPPMPWFALHAMTDNDLRAIYRFVRALGPAGEPAPAYVPPTQEPKPPYVTFPAPPK
jgi:mono/diheme cytochrome c family protein